MKIFIIGAGVMGGAIAETLARKNKVYFFDHHPRRKKISGAVFDAKLKYLPKSEYVFICIKPQDMQVLAEQIKINKSSVIISIAAGVRIPRINKLFNHKKVVRIMPNLGLSVGVGISAWKSHGLSFKEQLSAKKILNQISENFEVNNEREIDAVTAISGSGPAYFFYLAEALRKAAKNFGFEDKQSRQLVEKTFLGAALLQQRMPLLQEGHPLFYQNLINQVASKKGTTEAALNVFKKYKLDKIIVKAAQAAKKRAEEISHE